MPTRRIVIPLLVLGLAAALWFWKPGMSVENAFVEADTSRCMARLREIHVGLILYNLRTGHPPTGAGRAFLETLFAEGVWEDTPENRERLLCPSTGKAYAVRDAMAFPLTHFPSGGAQNEPLAACDGSERMPHRDGVNVLYSDGSVQTVLLEQEIERGRLAPGATRMPVGPDSPIPDLRKLSTH